MRCKLASTLAATAFPQRLEVDVLLFTVAARPADVASMVVVHAYEFNQVTARLIANLAGVQCALFRADPVFSRSFSHKFSRSQYKAIHLYSGVTITDSHISAQA